MPTITLPHAWTPRPYQLPLWKALETGTKRAIAIWHRRAGKDDVALHWAACAAVQRPAVYWHMLPEASQARKAIWDAVNPHSGMRRLDEAFPPEIRKTTRNQEMSITLVNGAVWQVVGSDNYNSLVGTPPAGVTFSEWALADPKAWAYIRPILAENHGWALFITTPRGRNHAHSMYKDALELEGWHGELLTVRETEVFNDALLAEERNEYHSLFGEREGEALFRQEYYCSFDEPIMGAYWAALIERAEDDGRIGTVSYDPLLPVETWWDLGIGDSTAIWFVQRLGTEIRLIDYYEASGEPLQHYVRVLQDKIYTYGQHILPHDARARELTSGKSREEVLRALGVDPTIAPNLSVDDGIMAVRSILPMCHFDRKRCERGIDALKQYRREWDDINKVFKKRPLHDWSSHAADAFRMGAVARPKKKKWEKLEYDNRGII